MASARRTWPPVSFRVSQSVPVARDRGWLRRSGANLQVTGLVGAGVIVLMLVVVPGLFRNLPQPTPPAVVMAAALSLADRAGMKRLWEVRRTEFALSIAAFFGVAVLGVLPGIAIAVGLSILNVFRRSVVALQHKPGASRGSSRLSRCALLSGCRDDRGPPVNKFDLFLFFANARAFRQQVRDLAAAQPRPRLDRGGRRAHHRRRYNSKWAC